MEVSKTGIFNDMNCHLKKYLSFTFYFFLPHYLVTPMKVAKRTRKEIEKTKGLNKSRDQINILHILGPTVLLYEL